MSPIEEYVEDMGLYYESVGLPKMAGRILGYIMASPEESICFDELVRVLHASKGSISGNLTLLTQRRLLVKTMKAGDRKSYYILSGAELFSILNAKIGSFNEVTAIMRRANELNKNPETAKYSQIAKIVRFYDFMARELPLLKEKWEKEESKRGSSA